MKLRMARKIGKAVGTRCMTQDMRSVCPHGGRTHRRSMKRLARSLARWRACGYVDKSVDNS